MTFLLIASTILISLALIFYSIGVWAERIVHFLKPWHVITFWLGFLCDVLGTLAMHKLAEGTFNLLDFHTLTGQLALWLMFAHVMWATHVVRSANEQLKTRFHRYSFIVWLIWLIPYFGGMYVGMSG